MDFFLIGYVLFFCTGLLFGLFGAGGSMMTIPILMLFFSFSLKIATAYSLIIVFLISILGIFSNSKLIKLPSVIIFGLSSLLGVYFSRNFLFEHVSEILLIILFISVLFICGLLMLIKEYINLKNITKQRMTIYKEISKKRYK